MAITITSVLGLAGVAHDERDIARRAGKIFEWPMIFLAFWMLFEWYLEAKSEGVTPFTLYTDWAIWLFFCAETITLLFLVERKLFYLRTNWGNLAIIGAGMLPLIWELSPYAGALRALRLLVIFSILINMSGAARNILSRNHLGTTMMVSFIIVVMSGTFMAAIDSNIETPLDGIWWAWVTITTVGYGDLVPATTLGRLFGSILILMGIGLFAMLTASFSAFFMTESEVEKEQTQKLKEFDERMSRLEEKIDRLLDAQTAQENVKKE